MKIPMSWLSDYTDMTGITPEQYNHALTMTGSKVEQVDKRGGRGAEGGNGKNTVR